MNKLITRASLVGIVVIVLLSSTGCSSSSSKTKTVIEPTTYSVDAQSIKLPEQFSIILDASKVDKQSPARQTASYAQAFSSSSRSISFLAAGYESVDTDYSKTEANIWDGNYQETLAFPNYLAKLLAQSNASEFVNKGKYIALFDELEKPYGGKESSGTVGMNDDGVNTSTKKEKAVFEVVQVDSDDALTIKMWMDLDTGWGEIVSLYGETVVTQNQSTDYPLGEFTIYYTMAYKDAAGNVRNYGDKNALSVSANIDDILIDYKNVWSWGTDDTYEFRFKNRVSKDYTTGAFKQLYTSTWSGETYSGSFDVAYNQNIIAQKDSYNYTGGIGGDTTRYYDITDEKFIVYNYSLFNESDGSKVSLNTGMSITYVDDSGITHYGWASPWGTWIDGDIQTGESVTSNFDSKVYTATVYRGNLQKEAIVTKPMSDLNATSCDVWECDVNGCFQYDVAWNSTSETMEYSSYYNENYELVTESGTLDFKGGYLWCGNKSYDVDYVNLASDINNTTLAKTFTYETITPDTAVDLTNLSGYVYDTGIDNNFSFNAASFMLKNETTGINVDATLEGEYIWQSFEDTVGNRYTWNISNDSWANSVLLKDSNGNTPQYDKPLEFKYTHTLANDRNDDAVSAGTVLELSYEGYGLWIPWNCNGNTCAPEVSLKDSTLLTDSNNDKYVVKATDIGVEYMELNSKPANSPEFITINLDDIQIDTSDFEYEDVGNTSSLEVKVINKVTQ